MLKLIFTLCLWAATCTAFVKLPQFTLKSGEGAEALPTLTLPYATYRAARYDPNGDVCSFLPLKNHELSTKPTCSTMSSRTSDSLLLRPAPSAGLLLPLPRRSLPFRMIPTVPSASKPQSKAHDTPALVLIPRLGRLSIST